MNTGIFRIQKEDIYSSTGIFPTLFPLLTLEPEFFSLWLFNRPILTDEMVINHLDQIPVLNKVPNSPHPEYGTTAPICIRLTNDAKGYVYLGGDY